VPFHDCLFAQEPTVALRTTIALESGDAIDILVALASVADTSAFLRRTVRSED
jgi:hypothetical protein